MFEIESSKDTYDFQPSTKEESFFTMGKVTTLCAAIFLAGQTFSWFEKTIGDAGDESIFTFEKAFDVRVLYGDLRSGEKLFFIQNTHTSIPKYMDGITLYVTGFVYPKNTLSTERILTEKLGFFPEEVLRKNLQAVVIGPIQKQDTNAYAKRESKYFKIKPQSISGSTPFHEMIHLIFLHTSDPYWTDLWIEKFGEHNSDNTTYAEYRLRVDPKKNYGMMNAMEDMATIGENMFSLSGWQSLEKSGKKNPIVSKKVEYMLTLFEERSDGFLDGVFFQNIREGKIKTSEDAQRYFSEKRRKR